MPEKVAFRTKPQPARRMLERALESGVPFGWVTGDEVYGNDRRLRLWLEWRDVPHLLAVRSNEKLWAETDRGWRQVRADRLAPGVEEPGWVRRSAGDGAKGPPGIRLGAGGNPAPEGAGQGVLAAGPAQHRQARGVGLLRLLRPREYDSGGTGAGGRNSLDHRRML